MVNTYITDVINLGTEEREKFNKLQDVYMAHLTKNKEKDRYYEGKIALNEVNLGIALPEGIRKLEIGCAWGAKTVDVLAGLSMFDGFVGGNGNSIPEVDDIVIRNQLISEYMKACRDELKYGCTFATLSKDSADGCRIRFHSPQTAAALWDGEKGRIDCGYAIIDEETDPVSNESSPTLINLYTEDR